MSQTSLPPQLGRVVNGHQWNGAQWVPLAAPTVGQISSGHQWNGSQWVPLPPPPPIGQISNGHRWDGTRWVPIQPAATAPPSLLTELHRFADAWQLTWTEKHGTVRLERVVAERKAMLGTAKLTYRATVTVDEAGARCPSQSCLPNAARGCPRWVTTRAPWATGSGSRPRRTTPARTPSPTGSRTRHASTPATTRWTPLRAST